MPPARRLLLPALSALIVLLTVAPAALAAPFTHVLTGGRITATGSGTGTWNQDGEHYKLKETASVSWNAEWIKSGIYENYGNVTLIGSEWVEDEADAFEANVGTGTMWEHQAWWDSSDDRWEWGDPVNCSLKGTTSRPGGITPRIEEPGWPVIVSPLPGVGWRDGSSCGADDIEEASTWVGDHIAGETQRNFRMGTRPYDKAKHTQSFTFSKSGNCPAFIDDPCTESYSGGGEMALECVLCVTEMTLEHRDQPSGNLREVPPAGTTDGNRVWITAKVQNRSNHAFESMIQWRERKSGRVLLSPLQGNLPVKFPARSTTTVVLEWDTSGFAWEKGRPLSERRIELITPLGGAVTNVKVLPKPVVMVHGWKATAAGWADGKALLKSVHPELDGRGYAVGDDRGIGTMNTDPWSGNSVAHNAQQMKTYIQDVRADLDAEHVDLLVHSMGGLISRWYVQELMPPSKDHLPVASHLLMLGTPNMGSPCADLMAAIGVDGIPTQQLRPQFVDGYMNRKVLERRGVPFSIMAGDIRERTCNSPRHGDLVVEVESAWWTLEDVTKTYAHHVELTDVPAIYTSWVRPRLGVDPDKAGNWGQYDPANLPDRRSAALTPARDVRPVARAAGDGALPQVAERRDVEVPANGSTEIALEVTEGSALVGVAMAPAGVTSELLAPDGTVVDPVSAGSEAAVQEMRFHRAEAPAHGVWRLRLSQSGGEAPLSATAGLAIEGSSLTLEATARRTDDGAPAALRADLRDAGAAVRGATVRAVLRADGHADRVVTLREGGDGRYVADEALPPGEWFGVVSATTGDRRRFASVMVESGAPDDAPVTPSGGGGEPEPPVTGPVGPTEPPQTVRHAPRELRIAVKRRRDRRAPYAYRLTGRLVLPAGVPASTCRGGQVAIVLARRGKAIADRTATLDAGCRFSAKVVSKRRRGRLVVRASFIGAPELLPIAAKVRRVRAG